MDGSSDHSDTVYLDYNATTPLEPTVVEVIHTALVHAWGNPSSSHGAGKSWGWGYKVSLQLKSFIVKPLIKMQLM